MKSKFPLFSLMQPDLIWFTMEWLHGERDRFSCVFNNVFSAERVNICPSHLAGFTLKIIISG